MSFRVDNFKLNLSGTSPEAYGVSMTKVKPHMITKRLKFIIKGNLSVDGSGGLIEPEELDDMCNNIQHKSKKLQLNVSASQLRKIGTHRHQRRFNKQVDNSAATDVAIHHEIRVDCYTMEDGWGSRPFGSEIQEDFDMSFLIPSGKAYTAFSGSLICRAEQVLPPKDYQQVEQQIVYGSQSNFEGSDVTIPAGCEIFLLESRSDEVLTKMTLPGHYNLCTVEDLDSIGEEHTEVYRSDTTSRDSRNPLGEFEGTTCVYDTRNHKTSSAAAQVLNMTERDNDTSISYIYFAKQAAA